MTKTYKTFLLTLGAAALLSGCDNSPLATGWLDWLKGKDEPVKPIVTGYTSEYERETQAGNYLAGQFAQYRQDWGSANKYLDRAITLDPSNLDLQQRAMILSMQAGDANRAIALARKVLEEDKKNILALLFISVDQIGRQEYVDAVRTLSRMPPNGIVDFIRPILIAWSKAPEKIFDEESLVANGPLQAYHALLIADYLGKVRDPDKYLVSVLTGGGADVHILEMMADAYNRQGKREIARKIYDTLILQYAGTTGVSPRLNILKEKRDNPEKAQGNKIQTPAQGTAEAFYNMAHILFQDKGTDSALVFARIAQHLDPSKEETKILMARMMVENGHTDEAIALYKSIGPESINYLEAQRTAAELLEQEGKIEDSIVFLEKVYEGNRDVNALIQIGDVYRRAEKHEEAIRTYDRAAEALGGKVGADYWHLLYARGMCYERIGNLKKAEEDLQAALVYKPDHPYLLNYLGYSWADQGKKLDKALEMVGKAAKLKPDDGYIIDSLGWVYYKMGQYSQASAELEKAIELVPYDPTINDHLGDAYWQVGRKNEARFQWQRALNHANDDTDKAAIEQKINEGLSAITLSVQEAKKLGPDEPVKQ